jgi:hypothetical protein
MLNYTNVTKGVWQCNDCGAYADKKENIVHYDSCQPGESKKWEDFYEDQKEDMENQYYDTRW